MRLRRSDCSVNGLTRVRRGHGFSYLDSKGQRVTDPETLARIESLVIPPAWRDVWICPDARGHLQATGTDAAGRKQYLYHPEWRVQQDRRKFRHIEEFGRVLPRLRRCTAAALERDGEPTRERVAACAVRLLDLGTFRVGNAEYAGDEGGFGLATLTREHIKLQGDRALFDYPGKSGVRRLHAVTDHDAAGVLRALMRRRSGPEEVLAYRQGRSWHRLGSDAINEFIKETAGPDSSAKDFRTWNATVLAAADLAGRGWPQSRRARERTIAEVVRDVSEHLGNTPAVARSAYIDPRVLDRYRAGTLIEIGLAGDTSPGALPQRRRRRLELAVLDLLD